MFRRRKSDPPSEAGPGDLRPEEPPEDEVAAPARARGPWDVSEVELDPEDDSLVDLVGLIVAVRSYLLVQVQVDEGSGQVVAVLMMAEEGAVELRPFAAPRHGEIWDDVRRQIAAEAARLGGTATEADGAFGKELQVLVPVQTPEGQQLTQPSRVLGINGPRWLLRATLLGRPAVEPQPDGLIETALRDVVVVRGDEAMAPGDPLPLRLPEGAEPAAPQE
jgi:hypothetical protein